MLGRVDLARAQVADQQLIAAEDVQRQKAVMIVVAMELTALLLAVDRIVGGVEVQHQPLRCPRKGGDELLDEHRVQAPGRRPVGTVLPTAQRRGAGQQRVAFDRRLERQVVAQCLMVIEVLVAQRQAV